MTEPVWLLKTAVLSVHNLLISRFGGLVDSALARSINFQHYEDHGELPRLAASYTAGIIRNHPFADDNKRTGFMAAYMFLDLNEVTLRADEISAVA